MNPIWIPIPNLLCDSPNQISPCPFLMPDSRFVASTLNSGGGGWIRTNVGVSQQIYSLPPLATRALLRREFEIMEMSPGPVNTFLRLTD